jgi:hypothetical protein
VLTGSVSDALRGLRVEEERRPGIPRVPSLSLVIDDFDLHPVGRTNRGYDLGCGWCARIGIEHPRTGLFRAGPNQPSRFTAAVG